MQELSSIYVSDRIRVVRGLPVLLDMHLSILYQIPTKRINEQVKRNSDRFPIDFMFQLNEKEWDFLRSQNATAISTWNKRRSLPYAFTEHGVLMLSSVLKSPIATAVNIQLMRVFISMRNIHLLNIATTKELDEMRSRIDGQDEKLEEVIAYLKQFIQQSSNRPKIGFR